MIRLYIFVEGQTEETFVKKCNIGFPYVNPTYYRLIDPSSVPLSHLFNQFFHI